jgi:thioredoxin 1
MAAEFSDEKFDAEVLKSDKPVLVDFWAPWCGPCRQLAPMIEQLATEYDGKVTVGKLNIDDNPNAAQNYGISGIPTLLLFKNGEVVDRVSGIPPKSKLDEMLTSA